ncbi:unnamed protein product [Amoebophrya sp. A120]|nr:unnamed protein product [Amoebophrya sp. A120]|eukprot:GSA120T00015024001.1
MGTLSRHLEVKISDTKKDASSRCATGALSSYVGATGWKRARARSIPHNSSSNRGVRDVVGTRRTVCKRISSILLVCGGDKPTRLPHVLQSNFYFCKYLSTPPNPILFLSDEICFASSSRLYLISCKNAFACQIFILRSSCANAISLFSMNSNIAFARSATLLLHFIFLRTRQLSGRRNGFCKPLSSSFMSSSRGVKRQELHLYYCFYDGFLYIATPTTALVVELRLVLCSTAHVVGRTRLLALGGSLWDSQT